MSWQLRHEGSPQVIPDLTLQQIVDGLRDALWESTDEVLGPGEALWRKIEVHPQLAAIAEELALPPPVRHEEPTSLDMNALIDVRSEEHTSELQSHHDLVCRLLLEKKNTKKNTKHTKNTTRQT